MIDTLLSPFSVKHELYSQLKKHQENKINIVDRDSIYLFDIFSFESFKIKSESPYSHVAYFSCSYTDDVTELELCFNPIFQDFDIPKLTIDISQLSGFGHSKSDLFKYKSIDEFVESECPSYIETISQAQLRLMLSHRGIQIVDNQDSTFDNFYMYGWQPKVFLSNENGSHHLASAQYIALRLNQPVPLTARLIYKVIRGEQLANFHDRYAAYITPLHELDDYFKWFDNSNIKFIRLDDSLHEYAVYFFKRTSENKRIIELFSSKFSSLNQILWKRLSDQTNNMLLKALVPLNSGCWSY